MQVDKSPFPVHVLECNNLTVLVRLEQAKSIAGKNVVIGEPRRDEKKYHRRQVALEKDEMGKNKLTITIGPPSQKNQ
jgi:predicted deacetylase